MYRPQQTIELMTNNLVAAEDDDVFIIIRLEP